MLQELKSRMSSVAPEKALGGMLCVFVFSLWINQRSALGRWPFRASTGANSDIFRIEIVPSKSTFSIWGVIYAWQISWIAYAVYQMLTGHPNWATSEIYLAFGALTVVNMCWLLAFDRQMILISSMIIVLMPTITWFATWNAYENFGKQGFTDNLAKKLNAGLLINGLACYATWVSIASVLNISQAIVWHSGIDNSTFSKVGLLAIAALIGFFRDFTTNREPAFGSLLWSPPCVIFWAAWGVLARQNYKVDNLLRVMVAVIFLGAGWFLFERFANLYGIKITYPA